MSKLKFIGNTKYYLFLLFFTLCSLSIEAIEIKGNIIDIATHEPISYANVILLYADSSFVSGGQSDENGEFLFKNITESGDYIIKISYIGYEVSHTSIEDLFNNVDLGVIRLIPLIQILDEVTIQANRIINRIDRQIIMPTLKQKEISDNGIDLLNNMKLRGVKIDPLQQVISKMNGDHVQIQLNGQKIEIQELIAIRPSEVLRIDYYDETGARYADDQSVTGVINIILKKQNAGGYIAFDATNAITTGFANDQLTTKLNYKKSELSILYKLNYRSYDERRIDQTESFNYPNESVIRLKEGINAPFGYTYHTVNLGYSFKNEDRTYFNIKITDNIRHRNISEVNNISYQYSPVKSVTHELYKSQLNSPALDLYLQQKIDSTQDIFLNLVGSYMNSDSKRNYFNYNLTDTLSSITDNVAGEKYSFIGEVVYENKIRQSILQAGVKYTQSHTNNKYFQTDLTNNLMNQSEAYCFVEWRGSFNKFSYMLGLGASRIWFKEDDTESLDYVFQPLIRIGYKANDYWGLKYSFRIQPTTPSLADLSNVIRSIDEFADRQGNPNLDPYQTYYNSLNVYFDRNKISTGITLKYNYAKNPIMNQVFLDQNSNRFIYTVNNQKSFENFNIQTEGTWYLPNDLGTIGLIAGYSNFKSRGNSYSHTLNDFYLFLQTEFLYKKFSLSITSMLDRYKELYGESVDFDEKNTQVVLKYKHKLFSVGLGILNPFGSDNWKTSSEDLSTMVSSVSKNYIDDNTNMIFLNFSFNFSIGHESMSDSRKLNNKDLDSGTMELK